MKKITFLAIATLALTFTACNSKKEATPKAAQEVETITDTAFQAKAAGEYKSYDGSKSITLAKDFGVTTKNDQDYYKWELAMQPQGNEAIIYLNKKGMDKDIQTQVQLDVEEGKMIVNNETYRK